VSARSAQRSLLFGLAGLFLAYISRLTLMNNDIFHAMSLFREALELGWVPQEDLYAFTPTVRPTVHHEWATGALLYLLIVATGFGAPGLMLLKYVVTAGIAVGCYCCARRRGASALSFVLLAPLVFPVAWVGFGTVRAQLFTLLFLTCLLLLLEVDRRGRRWWLAAWFPIYILWLNMHGGFVVGVGILVLHFVESFGRAVLDQKRLAAAVGQVWHLGAALVLMVPCLWINPFGTDYVVYLWHGLRMERPLISEWSPLWHTCHPLLTMEVFAISVGLIAYACRQTGMFRMPGILALLVTAWLALNHIRHGSIYAVVWLCYVPAQFPETNLGEWFAQVVRRRERQVAFVGILVGLVGLGVAASNRCWQLTILTHSDREPLVYPAGAVDYLAQTQFAGNLIVPFNTGAYVSWKLYPAVKISFDSRYEAAFPAGALEENLDFFQGKDGWQDTLERHGAGGVLVRRISPLDDWLASTGSSWERVYVDDAYSLFLRAELAGSLPPVDRTGEQIVASFP
jgi:hypothetical protein